TFGSYVMGLVRDVVQTRTFGAGAELDAYLAAFAIPEIALGVLVASGLSAPFVPIFLALRGEDERAAQDFAGTIMTLAILIIGVATPILFLLAPMTVDFVARGFGPEQRALYTDLFRLMLVTPVLFAVSDVLGEVLVAERRFLGYALAPVLYNAGIVLGMLLFPGTLGIFAGAVGAILGALLHVGIRIVWLRGSRVRFRGRLKVRTRAFREFVGLMIPKMASHPIDPLTFTILGSLASTVAVGGITSLSLARNFQSVPVTVIAISFALAVFPTLSAAAAAGDRRAFTRIVVRNAATIAVLTAVAAGMLALVSRFVIELFFRGGAFTDQDAERTSLVLVVMALSIPFESLTHLLSRAIFATRNTILQVLASVGSFVVIVVSAYVLTDAMGLIGIPLAFAIGMATKVALLSLALVPRIRGIRPAPDLTEAA
ncbi:MAG TPA: lipid II flippase MurJ, partial [Vitreimonas sp.]|nr:lipid II flippase MurJ [Vitreimonas sp.]